MQSRQPTASTRPQRHRNTNRTTLDKWGCLGLHKTNNSTLTLQGTEHFLLPALLPLPYTTPRSEQRGEEEKGEREEEGEHIQ